MKPILEPKVYSVRNTTNYFQSLIQDAIDATITSSQFEAEVRSFECTTDGLVS